MPSATAKPSIEAQHPRKKAVQTVKVSVVMPRSLYTRVQKLAKQERRLVSPAVVVLVERGLGGVNV